MRAPVGNTCPDIDDCIRWLDTAKTEIEFAYMKVEQGDETDYTDKVLESLSEALKYIDISDTLERLRSANSALRDWGYELASELEQLKRDL
jgi:hypothetical protein